MGPSGDSGGRVRGRVGTICWSARWADKEINVTRSNLQERSSDGGGVFDVCACVVLKESPKS